MNEELWFVLFPRIPKTPLSGTEFSVPYSIAAKCLIIILQTHLFVGVSMSER